MLPSSTFGEILANTFNLKNLIYHFLEKEELLSLVSRCLWGTDSDFIHMKWDCSLYFCLEDYN